MIEPKTIDLAPEAVLALAQILGIMLDQILDQNYESETPVVWNAEHIIDLEARLTTCEPGAPIELGIDDADLLLQGMAFTEVMSAQLPWIDTVRWVTDFVTSQLRQHWTDQEWQKLSL